MPINSLISIKNPITDAMDLLRIDNDKQIPFFTRLAILAEKEIGSAYQYVTKRAVLTITGCTACLPNEAEYLDVGIMGDQGCDCGDLRTILTGRAVNMDSTFGTTDNTFLVVDLVSATDNLSCGYPNFSIQNNKLVFEQNLDGQKITVQYLAVVTDCDGFVEVGQNHVQAIKWYIVYLYYYAKNNMNNYEAMKMKHAFTEWQRECSHARAQDAELTPSQRANIVGMYHNAYSGISLIQGMRITLGGNYIW